MSDDEEDLDKENLGRKVGTIRYDWYFVIKFIRLLKNSLLRSLRNTERYSPFLTETVEALLELMSLIK